MNRAGKTPIETMSCSLLVIWFQILSIFCVSIVSSVLVKVCSAFCAVEWRYCFAEMSALKAGDCKGFSEMRLGCLNAFCLKLVCVFFFELFDFLRIHFGLPPCVLAVFHDDPNDVAFKVCSATDKL